MLRGLWSCVAPLRRKLPRSISQCTKQKIIMMIIINCVAYAWICQNNATGQACKKVTVLMGATGKCYFQSLNYYEISQISSYTLLKPVSEYNLYNQSDDITQKSIGYSCKKSLMLFQIICFSSGYICILAIT